MDLKEKFSAIATGRIINVMDLEVGVKYPIDYAFHFGLFRSLDIEFARRHKC
jgi:hypothetical protein